MEPTRRRGARLDRRGTFRQPKGQSVQVAPRNLKVGGATRWPGARNGQRRDDPSPATLGNLPVRSALQWACALRARSALRFAARVSGWGPNGLPILACCPIDDRGLTWQVQSVLSERRQNELARVCAWCSRVYAGVEGWQPERRATPPSTPSHGICPTCAVDYRASGVLPPRTG